MYSIFLGAPGAGKGTQATAIAQKLNLAHIASGDLFRQALKRDTRLGRQAKNYIEKGELVPNEIATHMVLERMSAPDSEKGTVLDGFPRNLEQAKALDKALARKSLEIDNVISIKVSEEELQKRLGGRRICHRCQTVYNIVESPPHVEGKCDKCEGKLYQRPDDTAETIKKRLEIYFEHTAPLIDYYRRKGKLIEVDGEETVDEVTRRTVAALNERWLVAR